MLRLHIVSPNPETLKLLALAFELRDVSVYPSLSLNLGAQYNGIIIDVVQKTDREWSDIESALKSKIPTILLVPPCHNHKNKLEVIGRNAVLIRKPYELIELTNRVCTQLTAVEGKGKPKSQRINPKSKVQNPKQKDKSQIPNKNQKTKNKGTS